MDDGIAAWSPLRSNAADALDAIRPVFGERFLFMASWNVSLLIGELELEPGLQTAADLQNLLKF